ncbi:MAG: cupin domain-containing protein [Opitutales bacterium]|nr:cupin domain-containing protein [Opitutales bacterium]
MTHPTDLISVSYDELTANLSKGKIVERRLSEIRDSFLNPDLIDKMPTDEDPIVYRVTAVEPSNGTGDLHYGLGIIYPGKVGPEYFLTKGHLHQARETAEVYIGLSGEGYMLLENEKTLETRMEPLGKGQIVYVPGHTAHRTVNTGDKPLTYFGVYPANAGHDYGAIGKRNFLKVIVEENGKPTLKDR